MASESSFSAYKIILMQDVHKAVGEGGGRGTTGFQGGCETTLLAMSICHVY